MVMLVGLCWQTYVVQIASLNNVDRLRCTESDHIICNVVYVTYIYICLGKYILLCLQPK